MAQDSFYSEKETNRFCKADVQVIGLDLVCHYLGLSLSFPGNCSLCSWNKDSKASHVHPRATKWWPGPGAIERNSEPFQLWRQTKFQLLVLSSLTVQLTTGDSLSPWILPLLCFCWLAFKRGFHSCSQTGFELSHCLYWPWIHNPLNADSWVLELQDWAITPTP